VDGALVPAKRPCACGVGANTSGAWWEGSVSVCTLGRIAWPLLPEPVTIPQGTRAALVSLENVIGRLATAVRLHDVSDHVYDDALKLGYSDYGSWVIGDRDGKSIALDPLVEALCDAAAIAANRRLPHFVASTYRVVLTIRPILKWENEGRVEGRLEPVGDGIAFSMDRVAAGFRVWLELALLEAVGLLERYASLWAFLESGSHDWDLEETDPPEEVAAVAQLLRSEAIIDAPDSLSQHEADLARLVEWTYAQARHDPGAIGDAIDLDRGRLYLLDEPERHLHPRLQRAAARWLEDTFRQVPSQAVVATHAPAFLNGGPDVQLISVRRGRETSGLPPLDGAALRATDQLAREMGYDRGELFAGIAAVLYVEGRLDRVVIESLFGEQLRSARIVVSAFGGTYNITEVVHDPLAAYTTAPAAVLVDNARRDKIQRLKSDPRYRARVAAQRGGELRALARLIDYASSNGKGIEPFGHSKRDIFFFIDDIALKRSFDRWPGHDEADRQWRRQRRSRSAADWKDFYYQKFGVAITAPALKDALADMHERGDLPAELRGIVADVERLSLA
jgi:hypothetical protein